MIAITSKRVTSTPSLSSRSGKSSKLSNSSSTDNHLCNLSFYTDYPKEAIAIDDFEQYAIDRLQVLRRGDVLKTRGVTGEEFKHEMIKSDAKHLPANNPMKDYVSHYILRLAYCRTEELRRWFLTQECQLFALRFATSTPEQIDAFMESANLRYTPIPTDEKTRLAEALLAVYRSSLYGLAQTKMAAATKVFKRMDFYKVPFMDVLPLVSKRQVYIEKGFAYVPRSQLATLIQGVFRAKLSKDLSIAYKSANLIQSDERIAPLVRNLGRIAYRMGRAASAVDSESVLATFSNYLAEIGHSQPKAKPAGQDRFYIAVGYRKANDKDRTCPIAGRIHKSNTQKYTVYCDTQVMMQGCWDGACQDTGKHVFYQIQGNKVVNCGWNAPPPPQQVDASGKNGGSSSSSSSSSSAPSGFNK